MFTLYPAILLKSALNLVLVLWNPYNFLCIHWLNILIENAFLQPRLNSQYI